MILPRNMLGRRIKDRLKEAYLEIYKLGIRLGFYVLPVHYYVSEPNILELKRTQPLWARASTMPGVEVDLDRQVDALRTVCLPYRAEYAGNHYYKRAVAE